MDAMVLDGGPVSIDGVHAVALRGARVSVSADAIRRASESRRVVDAHLSDGLPHYGINTGFGSLSRQRISPDDLRTLQRNLVRSHAAGVGETLPDPVVRAMMLLLAASLARGLSGVRPIVIERLLAVLNAGLTPIVPSLGSVGASGDLAPLAHVALVLIGEGRARLAGADLEGGAALRACSLEPLVLEAKEGLALINGTHLMAAQAALLCAESSRVFDAAILAAAMSIDACRATDAFLDPRVYAARAHPGPAAVARSLKDLLHDSQILPSHRENDPRVQDPYSLRCAPVVLGAVLEAFQAFRTAAERELAAVTDNPLVFPGAQAAPGAIISAGNFHGMPIAIPLDAVALAIAHLAGIAERRVYYMLSATEPETHLRAYLSTRPGLNSGLMIAQYTAAACCNEIVGLCTPASVANLSTSAGMEDYNSFGPRAAAKARRALELARHVVAIELLCAAQALEAHRPLRSGEGVERAHAAIRAVVPRLEDDRPPAPDIERIAGLIERGALGSPATAGRSA